MSVRRFLVILLLFLLPLQATLAAADSCCVRTATWHAGEQAAVAADAAGQDGACCTECGVCHHSHAAFAAALADGPRRSGPEAPVLAPEPPIHSFIPDIPPHPDRLR